MPRVPKLLKRHEGNATLLRGIACLPTVLRTTYYTEGGTNCTCPLYAADTSAPVACGYFSQEANASGPAPWHKESSGTMLSDALIDGRVGVKDISCLLDTQKEIVEELNQDPVTKFHSFHQYFGSRHF